MKRTLALGFVLLGLNTSLRSPDSMHLIEQSPSSLENRPATSCPNTPGNCRLSFRGESIVNNKVLSNDDSTRLFREVYWTRNFGGEKRRGPCVGNKCTHVYQSVRVAQTAYEADIKTLEPDIAYAVARIDLAQTEQGADKVYGLSSGGPKDLARSFFFFAKKLRDGVNHPADAIAELQVFGYQRRSKRLIEMTPSSRIFYIRECPQKHSKKNAKGAFSGCKEGRMAEEAADSLGMPLMSALSVLKRDPEQTLRGDTSTRRLWTTVNQMRTDTPDGLAWFTCATGCCTADALVEEP